MDQQDGRRHSAGVTEPFVPATYVQPALRFLRQESASGVLMLVAAIVALLWANGPAADSYFAILDASIEIRFGDFAFHHLSELTVREWVNDAAMVLFFFVVGLEIKRELVAGELRDPRAAALPVLAAVGGMVLPAAVYLLFNLSLLPGADAAPAAWGIPMATDIAFAVGIVALLGTRVPVAAKLFLLALAIVDDLGAILVIAIVYTEDLAVGWLLVALVTLGLVVVLNRIHLRTPWVFLVLGAIVWLALLESGVHATLAGVAMAMLTPTASFHDPRRLAASAGPLLERIHEHLPDEGPLREADHHTMERVSSLVADLRRLTYDTLPPLTRLQYRLSPISSFVVVPVFALANGGVRISQDAIGQAASDPILLGVLFGLVVGKTVGVSTFAWVAVRLGLARMPHATTWRHMLGLSMLAGIGFTVALFVASLSLTGPDVESAKLGIFAGSLLAGLGGYAYLRRLPEPERPGGAWVAHDHVAHTA